MSITWVPDDAGVAILDSIGISSKEMQIEVKDIDKKKSKENRARKNPLDRTRVFGIESAMIKGVPIPMIVVRKSRERFIIAGGNHRFASIGNQEIIPVHVIGCTDAEFEVACRLLNTVVGEGMTKDDRVESAIIAVEQMGMSVGVAAEMYGVGRNTVSESMSANVIRRKLAAMPLNVRKSVNLTHIRRLGDLANNDNILRAAATMVTETRITADELQELAKVARTKTTESAQISVFEEGLKQRQGTEIVPRRLRKKLLSALTQLQSFNGKNTWESVEVNAEDTEAFRKQVQEVVNILSCLLKASG
jgi:transposase